MTIDPPFGTTIKLNQAFIDAHGAPMAEAFLAEVNRVAQEHGGRPIGQVREAFDAALAKLGLDMPQAERDSYADQIARSERVHVTAGPVDIPDDHAIAQAQAQARQEREDSVRVHEPGATDDVDGRRRDEARETDRTDAEVTDVEGRQDADTVRVAEADTVERVEGDTAPAQPRSTGATAASSKMRGD